MNRIICGAFSLLFAIGFSGYAQVINDSTVFVSHSRVKALDLYESFINEQSGIFNGREYIEYDFRIKGHPYFRDEDFTPGSVEYFGQRYDNVELKYNTHKNILVVEYYDHIGYGKELALDMDRVDAFKLFGHEFIKIEKESDYSGLKKGFYDQLLNSKDLKVLCLREKELYEKVEGLSMERSFLLEDKFYIVKHGEVVKVSNKISVISAFKDKKKEVKKFIKQNMIDFKPDFEHNLLKVSQFYVNL